MLDLPGLEDQVESNRTVAFSRQVRSMDIGAVSEEQSPMRFPFLLYHPVIMSGLGSLSALEAGPLLGCA